MRHLFRRKPSDIKQIAQCSRHGANAIYGKNSRKENAHLRNVMGMKP
jgi:hypothetical protein